MQLSNKLLWALRDHSQMKSRTTIYDDQTLADICLIEDLEILEKSRNAQDEFDRPIPIPVKINLETGAIEV